MKDYSELALFGKTISTALLMIGYILLGHSLGRKLVESGRPSWTHPLLVVLGTVIGAHQMIIAMREMIRKIKK